MKKCVEVVINKN